MTLQEVESFILYRKSAWRSFIGISHARAYRLLSDAVSYPSICRAASILPDQPQLRALFTSNIHKATLILRSTEGAVLRMMEGFRSAAAAPSFFALHSQPPIFAQAPPPVSSPTARQPRARQAPPAPILVPPNDRLKALTRILRDKFHPAQPGSTPDCWGCLFTGHKRADSVNPSHGLKDCPHLHAAFEQARL